MSNSNTIWSDKDTARWFVIQLHGHEGPYSLKELHSLFAKRQLSGNSTVWCEGLESSVVLMDLLRNKEDMPPLPLVEEKIDVLPDLPPEPEEEIEEEHDVPPPLPILESSVKEIPEDLPPETPIEKKKAKIPVGLIGIFFLLLLGFLFLFQWIKSFEEFKISRHPKMSGDLYDKITKSFEFEGWKKEIFFREFVANDLSRIWLVTSGFQSCQIEAQFISIKDKLLVKEDVMVQFTTKGVLKDHVTEFSKFDFLSGYKIIPGMYEMDIKAHHCEWGSWKSKVANIFSAPQEVYQARMRVILYSKGAAEYQKILELLLQKKQKEAQKLLAGQENFWSEIQQKFQTLDAIASQIETFFLEFLNQDTKSFEKNVKIATDVYTKKYGHSLTRFVVSNEEDFKRFSMDILKLQKGKNYEESIRLVTKSIGFESMKIIEELQSLKKPKRESLNKIKEKTKKVFLGLHENLSRKILQVSEDRQP